MRPVNLRVGAASAIGSLPHRQVDAAVALALAAAPDLPAAPSLPALDGREHMIAQAAWGMTGVEVTRNGDLVIVGDVDPAAPFGDDADAAGIDGPPFVAMRSFLGAVRHRTGPIKLQATGPVTLALALIDAGVDVDRAFAVAGAAAKGRILAMLDTATRAAPLAPKVLFVDEPGLTALSSPDFPYAPDLAVDLVSSSLAAAEEHAVTGLHCCGDTDWRLALATGPQIVSMPVGSEVLAYAGTLGVHLDRGGWVAWGAVPTSGPLGDGVDRLWRRLSETWCSLVQRGCDGLRLRDQALVTPECGLATHDSVQAETILGITGELSERVRRQSFGVRLSIGA